MAQKGLFDNRYRFIYLLSFILLLFFAYQLYQNISLRLEYKQLQKNSSQRLVKVQTLKTKKAFLEFLETKMFHSKNNARTQTLLQNSYETTRAGAGYGDRTIYEQDYLN